MRFCEQNEMTQRSISYIYVGDIVPSLTPGFVGPAMSKEQCHAKHRQARQIYLAGYELPLITFLFVRE